MAGRDSQGYAPSRKRSGQRSMSPTLAGTLSPLRDEPTRACMRPDRSRASPSRAAPRSHGLRPLLALTILLRLVEALKIIDIPFALTAGGPGRAKETFSIFIYRTAFTGFDVGYASAASFLFLIIVLVVVNAFVIFGRFRSSWDFQAR